MAPVAKRHGAEAKCSLRAEDDGAHAAKGESEVGRPGPVLLGGERSVGTDVSPSDSSEL